MIPRFEFLKIACLRDEESEAGFTLVELIISVAIISILVAMSLTSFYVYKNEAEYTKADSDLRNARTAAEVGLQEAEQSGAIFGLTFSSTDGSSLAGDLASMLPGANVSPQVQLGASLDPCLASAGSDVSQEIIARSCKAERYASWLRQCDGTEVFVQNVALGAGC